MVELLDTDNYVTWSTKTRLELLKKSLWSIVQNGADKDDEQAAKDNDRAYALIGLRVKDYHLNTVASTTSAKELWDTLASSFQAKSNAKRLLLRRELNTLSKRAEEQIPQYVARAKSIWTALIATGYDCKESEVTLSVLAGLPAEYDMIVTVLTTTDDELALDDIIPKLLPMEQKLSSQRETVAAYNARNHQRQHRPSGQHRSLAQHRSAQPQTPRNALLCYYCGKPGHIKAECRHRIANERNHRGTGNHRDTGNHRNTVAFSATTDSAFNGQWVMDSGASRHITYDKDSMLNFRVLESSTTITFGNGQQAKAAGTGEVLLNTNVSGNATDILLLDVLYVPEAKANLFSIKQAASSGASIVFKHDKCVINKNGRTCMEGFIKEGIYILRQEEQLAFAASSKHTPELWHRRLGHLGYNNLYKLKTQDMVEGLPISAADIKAQQSTLCEPCVKSKQHRLPFPDSERKSSRPMELLHMDVCGPMQEASHAGAVYLATFLDDYSKLSVVRTLANKSDVPAAVKEVVLMLETQTGQKLRMVRTDRGSEYLNAPLMDFFKSKGIIHETTAPYTPQQNGAAERLNRTLMDRVRAMVHGAGLDVDMWAEAAITANYIRNRSPATGRAKTPWELFNKRKPDISHMRVFGARAFVHIPKQFRRKLDSLSSPGIFIGYAANSKAYRVLLDDGKITVTRDVTFDEAQQQTAPASGLSTKLLIMEEPDLSDEGSDAGSDTSSETPSSSVPSEAPPIPSEAAATVSPTAASTQARYPGRQRRQPKEWYKVQALAAGVSELEEPQTYEQAIHSPNAEQWKAAMDEEMASLQENNTWSLEERPVGVQPVEVKWVFKIKKDAQGNVERFKARLVAKGYMQKEGIDFNEVFAPVSKYTSLRALLSMAAAHDMEVHQLDIKTAFLNGNLEETIYMKQPQGYEEGGASMVCHLQKSLYGLRQAPRAWHTRLKSELESMGFSASEADPGLYTADLKDGRVYILVYVDDILIVAKSIDAVNHIKVRLSGIFDVRDLGEANQFLGIKISRSRPSQSLQINQQRMITQLVEKYGLKEAKTKSVPMSPDIRLVAATEDNVLDKEVFQYSELVGSLLYLSVCTRPDITYAVGALARHMSKPTMEHWTAAKAVLRYLAGTTNLGIVFTRTAEAVEGYCDADYAGDVNTRRSTTGFVFILNGGAISWSSKLQPTVAVSTAEAEYMAAAQSVKEALWLRTLLKEFELNTGTLKINSDNQGALKLMKHPMSSAKSKHIDVIHHFARERIQRKEVNFEYCSTDLMVADCMTKALPKGKFEFCCKSMGVV